MASPQIQFRAVPPMDTHLAVRVGGVAPTRSEVARRDLTRYYTFISQALAGVTLTEAEALLLCNALGGTVTGGDVEIVMLVAHLHHEIADTAVDGLDEKWGVDVPALVAKIASWVPFQRLGVIDAVERWWRLPNRNARPYVETLTEVGLIAPTDRLPRPEPH